MSKGRKSYQEELIEVKEDVLDMASLAKRSICLSIEVLGNYDQELLEEVYELEKESNKLNLEVEKECLRLVALQQPVATDLRFIASMMKISDNFERICDLAEKIADISKRRGHKDPLEALENANDMIDVICDMINEVTQAIENEKTEGLRDLSKKDDIVDNLFSNTYDEMIESMVENPENVDEATDLVFVARYLERTGDLINKIAARLIYLVDGERVKIK